ncbi:MAG TPA: twin-arginine translocase subunit TatC, partial [Acidimicrobiales bacterium]|nr:twin-arginine translocase subunit TatC [Acidimicrobiales bacterium]
GLLILMMFIFGLGFEFPILLVFLEIAHVIKWQQLASWRRYAIVGIFVVDALITPSGDPITLLAMAIPMCIFYEVAILIGRFALHRGD